MSKRAIVSVATGHYVVGQTRLSAQLGDSFPLVNWVKIPAEWPSHQAKPYAFKAYALKEASGYDTLLWCDASIVLGPRPLADLFEKIERDGYWIARNGWTNYEWTADSAYPALFPGVDPEQAREVNRTIPHVVATAFGLSMNHPLGRVFLAEYYRLASETDAFCGPWANAACAKDGPVITVSTYVDPRRVNICGPWDVRGHRHDQTAASVIAWRLKMKLSDCPEWFAYKGSETDKTCLVAAGI